MNCPRCARPVALARPSCLYCGAPIEALASGPSEGLAAGDEHAREVPVAAEPEQVLLIVDARASRPEIVAEVLGLMLYEADQAARGGRLRVLRSLPVAEAQREHVRLTERGVCVYAVPDRELRECGRPLEITGGDRTRTGLELRAEDGSHIRVTATDLLLVVHGRIERRYQDRAPTSLKRPPTASLGPGHRIHLHRRSELQPLEIDPAAFAFAHPTGPSVLIQLREAIGLLGGDVAQDEGFGRETPALAPAAPEKAGAFAASALRTRSSPSAPGKDRPAILDNVAQFRHYSSLRAVVERRRTVSG